MQRMFIILSTLLLASLACSLDFNPPGLALTPQAAIEASATPRIVLATLTSAPSAIPNTPAAPVQAPATSVEAPALTVEQLRNTTFNLTSSDQVARAISLTNGSYTLGTDPSQPGYISVTMGEKIAFGDLNGDGVQDAAVTLAENYGGTGVFVSVLAVINQSGQPNPMASALLEDRPMLNDISIQNGEIFLDITVHGPNDPMCCPSQPSTRTYRLFENTLTLSRLTTKTPGGAERIIRIDAPVNGTEINAPFVVKGSVTISPFENNLVYAVYQNGNPEPLEQAGFIINADGLGGPGTFELLLDPGKLGVKGPFRIEFSDVSPADGSTLALCSVYLVFK